MWQVIERNDVEEFVRKYEVIFRWEGNCVKIIVKENSEKSCYIFHDVCA